MGSFIDGHFMRLFVDGKAIAAAKVCNVKMSMDSENVTTKDTTGSGKAMRPTFSDFSCDSDCLYERDSATLLTSHDVLIEKFNSKKELAIKFTDNVPGTKAYVFNMFCMSVDMSAKDRESTTFKASFKSSDGAMTTLTNV